MVGGEGRTQETGARRVWKTVQTGGLAMTLAEHLGSESLGGRIRQLVKETKKRDNYYSKKILKNRYRKTKRKNRSHYTTQLRCEKHLHSYHVVNTQ